mmetsp:Transcript_21143/g.30462  ORF Transcript_21143/g.30462 Transcript_21143/m.30462 type:complete len:144 (-) Transcript_21143:709-1140(-)
MPLGSNITSDDDPPNDAVLTKSMFTGPPSKPFERQGSHCASSSSRPRRRGNIVCGVFGCDSQPAKDNEMWLLLQNDWINYVPGLPRVPAHHPKHVVCRQCGPRGERTVDPTDLLNDLDAKDLPYWKEYTYQIATLELYRKYMG